MGVLVDAQRSPQFTPSQVAVVPLPIGPSGHGRQRVPHVASEKFETHWPLHSWKPTLQAIAQAVPLHDAVPLMGAGHGVQLEPQVAIAVFETHCDPHW